MMSDFGPDYSPNGTGTKVSLWGKVTRRHARIFKLTAQVVRRAPSPRSSTREAFTLRHGTSRVAMLIVITPERVAFGVGSVDPAGTF